MSKLSDMKAALKQIEELGMPISNEQKRALRIAENTYVQSDIIPKIKDALKGVFSDVDHKVKIIIDYDGNPDKEPNVYKDIPAVNASTFYPDLFGQENTRNTGLQVTFPDGRKLQDRGFEVLMAIVKEVGPDLVHEMDITCCGLPLVDDHRSEGRYGKDQKELPGGYWLITNSNTIVKKAQIDAISDNLGLNLKVEVLNAKGDVVDVDSKRNSSTRSQRANIRVKTPDGKVFYHDLAWQTLGDVVLYAGVDKVRSLALYLAGIPLVDDHLSGTIYAKQQHEITPGFYLNTYSDTKRKVKQIQEISDRLKLGLEVETI